MNRVTHFEIQAEDLSRAVKFYTDVFAWKFEKWENPGQEYWMITTGEEGTKGINGGMWKRTAPIEPYNKNTTTYHCTIEVDNIDAYMDKIVAAGGKTEAKVEIPGMGWLCNAWDTEGNGFGLMQSTS